MLGHSDFKLPFEVYIDAYDYQLREVIMQHNNPVTFYSRALNSAQWNYTIMEKELLSVIETVAYHSKILLGF